MFTTFRYLSLISLLLAGISFSGCESIEGRIQEADLDENFDKNPEEQVCIEIPDQMQARQV